MNEMNDENSSELFCARMNTTRKLIIKCQAYSNLGEVLVIGFKFVYTPTAFLVFSMLPSLKYLQKAQ